MIKQEIKSRDRHIQAVKGFSIHLAEHSLISPSTNNLVHIRQIKTSGQKSYSFKKKKKKKKSDYGRLSQGICDLRKDLKTSHEHISPHH